MPNTKDDIFPKREPSEHWRIRATNRRVDLSLTEYAVSEAPEIVRMALGEDLNDIYNRKDIGDPLSVAVNPLGKVLHAVTDADIVELVELAAYLRRLVCIPGFDKVVTALPSSYRSTLLQIAFATRFQSLPVSNLRLEPTAVGGLNSDISFDYLGTGFQVECYRPDDKAPPASDVRKEVSLAVRRIAKALERFEETPIRVGVHFETNPLTTEARVNLQNALCGSLMRLEVAELPFSGVTPFGTYTIEAVSEELTEFAHENGAKVPAPPYDSCTLATVLKRVQKTEVIKLYDGGREKHLSDTAHHRVFVWTAHTDFGAAEYSAELVAKKVAKRKLAQTKTSKGNERLVIVELPDYSPEFFRAILGQLRKRNPTSEGVGLILVSRRWTTQKRWGYGIYCDALGVPSSHMVGLVNSLGPNESKFDVTRDF